MAPVCEILVLVPYLKLFVEWKSITGTLASSIDPDEMPHDVAFHQGLHCLLRQSLEKEMYLFGNYNP